MFFEHDNKFININQIKYVKVNKNSNSVVIYFSGAGEKPLATTLRFEGEAALEIFLRKLRTVPA